MAKKSHLTVWQKGAFGLGAFGKDIMYMIVAAYLLNYYNVVLGMNSAFIGAVMMAARVFDAFNDPIMGVIVAKTKSRWGRFRPWIFSGTVLNAFVLFALFGTPEGADPNGGLMQGWLIVTYFAWGITYTMMDIPFWSMIPAITEPGKDREQVSSLGRAAAGVGGAIPSVLTMTVVPLLGGGAAAANMKTGYTIWAIIIGVVFIISETICVIAVKEANISKEEKTATLKQMFTGLFKNDQALTIVVSILCLYGSFNICTNLILYFFQFDVGNQSVYSIFSLSCCVAQIISMAIIPMLRRWFTKRTLYIAGFLIQIISYLVLLLMAFTGVYSAENWAVLIVPGAILYTGYGIISVILTIFLSDSVDYGEYKNGSREESVIFSMQTFTVKLASGLAVFLVGFVIQWINLDVSDGAVNTIQTLTGLRVWMTVPPVLLLIAGLAVFLIFYKLDDAMMEKISKKIRPSK